MENEFNKLLITIEKVIIKRLNFIKKLSKSFILKEDNSPVSKSDLYCEKIILNSIKNFFPSAIVYSEESIGDFPEPKLGDLIFVIDPIDGTENFVSGIELWGIAISIWRFPYHQVSFIFLPEIAKSITTGQQLTKSNSRIMGFSSSVDDNLKNQIISGSENRIFGCSVYNFYNIIRGSFKTFSNPKGAYIWDMLAGVNLALEHGCKVTVEGKEYHGEFLDPNKRHRFKVSNE